MLHRMRQVTRGPTGLTLAVAIAALLLGAERTSAAEGTLVAAQSSDVLTLDASADTSPIGINVRKNIYDQLTEISPTGKVLPMLATSWESSQDAVTWTFTMRSDAKFHNGEPVTADDVVWTFQKIMADQKSPVRTYLAKVKSVEKEGDNKVRFVLVEPFAPFDRQASLIGILPKKAYEEIGAAQFSQKPIGSGPFKVVRWVKDDRIELEAFPEYWGGAPKIKTVIFRPVPSEASRASALLSGEIQVVPVLPPALVDRLSARKGVRIEKVASHKILYLGFDVTNPLLSDVRLRRAVDLAIDREAITQKLLRGNGRPSGQIVAPVSFGHDPSIKPTAQDVERARQLVKESGYKGDKIVFQYPNNNLTSGDEVAQAIAGYLQAVGINVELQGMEYTAFFPLWAGRKLNSMHLFAYGPTILDADLPLTSLFETGRSRGYWSDPQVDDLIRRQRAETDPEKRQALISQVWRINNEHLPYITLHNEVQAYGIREGVKWTPRPDEILMFKEAELTQAN